MNNDFIEYCKDARRTFVNKFMKTYPTASERVMAEDLLIAYDQLMQRHEEMREIITLINDCPRDDETGMVIINTKKWNKIYDVLRNNS